MRKHLLLGSTAVLVGALAAPEFVSAEEPLRLSVRGYKNEFFGLGDVDNDSNPGQETTSEFSDGEVHFKGSTKLDNGLEVGVHIELEAFGATGDDIDEAYTFLQGDFGKVVIGSENTPEYLTFWGVTAPNVGVPINSGWISVWAPIPAGIVTGFRSPLQTTNVTLTNDTFQIGYQSPRFSGFQFVAGYAPTNATSGDPKNAVTDEDVEETNIFTVGANFAESFNGVDVGVAAGYGRAEVADFAEAAGADDPEFFKVGASIGVGGFSVAGSYANMFEGETNLANTTSNEGQSYDVGVSYSTGPWGVSAAYIHGEEENIIATSGDDEVDAFVGAVSYSLGPGITASGSIFYGEWEDEGGTPTSESVMGILGLAISF